MQVYGLIGQTEEGIWPEAQLRSIYYTESKYMLVFIRAVLQKLETSTGAIATFVADIFTIIYFQIIIYLVSV
jgi:hypothetical protein